MPIHLFVQSRQDRAEVDKDLIRAWVAGLLEQVDEPQTFDARLHDLLRTPCSEEQATGAACFIPGMGERYGMPLPALRLIAAELAKWGQRRPPQVFALVERLWRNGLRDERGRAAKMLECLSKHEWAETLELATSFVGDVRNWEECEQLACFGLRNVVQRYPEAMLSCCKAWGQDEDKWMRRFGVAILTSLPKDKGYRLSEREFAIFGCSDGRRSAGGEEHSRLGAAGDRQAAPPAARAAAPFCGRPAPGFDKLPFDQGLICRYNSLKLATSYQPSAVRLKLIAELLPMTDELTLKTNGSLLPWKITEVRGESTKPAPASVVIEEPLEIRINDQPVAVLMRTPGAEKELAVGFCLSEGLITDLADIALVHHCGRTSPTLTEDREVSLEESRNMVRITLTSPSAAQDPRLDVVRLVRSGCGRTDAEELASQLTPLDNDLRIQRKILLKLTSTIKREQEAYREAGGIHAAGIFTSEGKLVTIDEDIGRHNAVDKVLGHCLMRGITLKDKILVSTGRASYEMVTKAVRLGLPVAASLSSPTSLAVELAEHLNCTLIGYLRGQRMRVYTHAWRLER